MGNTNPDPTLNKVEGHFERDEDLEWDWDISDLREIPEEFQDWDDIWNSPQGCSDSLFSTPSYEYYSEGSLGEESDPEEYLEELQAVLQRTPCRYKNTWVAGDSPRCGAEKRKQRYTVEEARGQISMDQEEDLLSLRDLDQPIEVSCEIHQRPRTDLDIVAEMIEQEERTENIEKLNTEVKEQSCRTGMQSQRASKEPKCACKDQPGVVVVVSQYCSCMAWFYVWGRCMLKSSIIGREATDKASKVESWCYKCYNVHYILQAPWQGGKE